MATHHYVYAALDTSGNIGYVGITSRSPQTRWREHVAEYEEGSKSWPAFVDRWQVLNTYTSRAEAKARESELIAKLSPPWNIAENRHSKVRRADAIVRAWKRNPRRRRSKLPPTPTQMLRRWDKACEAVKLKRPDGDGPKIDTRSIEKIRDGVYRMRFEPPPGATTEVVAKMWEPLAAQLHVHRLYIETTDRPDTGYMTCVLVDPFPGVTPLILPDDPNCEAVQVGRFEDGSPLMAGIPGFPTAHHQLWAGVTGSGKSTGMRTYLAGVLARGGVVVYGVDPKQAEFTLWGDRLNGLILEEEQYESFFTSVKAEMLARKRWLSESGYHEVAEGWRNGDPTSPPPMVVAIDEFASLTAGGRLRSNAAYLAVERVAQEGRGLGVLLCIGTQYPDVGTLPNKTRQQLTWKMALAMGDATGTGIVLGQSAAKTAPAHLLPLRRGLGYMRVEGTKNYPLVQTSHTTPDQARSIAAGSRAWRVPGYGLDDSGAIISPMFDPDAASRRAVIDVDGERRSVSEAAEELAELCGYAGEIASRDDLAAALAGIDPEAADDLDRARCLAETVWPSLSES